MNEVNLEKTYPVTYYLTRVHTPLITISAIIILVGRVTTSGLQCQNCSIDTHIIQLY